MREEVQNPAARGTAHQFLRNDLLCDTVLWAPPVRGTFKGVRKVSLEPKPFQLVPKKARNEVLWLCPTANNVTVKFHGNRDGSVITQRNQSISEMLSWAAVSTVRELCLLAAAFAFRVRSE